jgi:hypothetical protein
MIRGALFTRFFLEDGIRQTQPYVAIRAADAAAFATAARKHWAALAQMRRPSEAETEAEFIYPVLALLGWEHLPQQEPGRGRRDIADALLFTSADAKTNARGLRHSSDRFRHGTVVVENEARDTQLDRASGHAEDPSSQILRYLRRAESESNGAVRWGLLTNGRFWRLYWAGKQTRAEGFVEIDFAGLIGPLPPAPPKDAPEDHWLRVFLLLFARDAFLPQGISGRSFVETALEDGRRYEQRITAALSRTIFDEVFPALVSAIYANAALRDSSPPSLAKVREAALRLLYRLLFLFYAEDRDLLPVRAPGYEIYSLRALRQKAAQLANDGKTLSSRAQSWWSHLTTLFAAISAGDPSMGLPPYNGGLFSERESGLLATCKLPDSVLAPLIEAMSREGEPGERRWINYRDLSVQQLGSIYERLLERDPVPQGEGVTLRPNRFARKTSGSYYTPDELVMLILRRTIGPLLEERRAAFSAKSGALSKDRRSKRERIRDLEPHDAAAAFLKLRICDPAMGSGHFLVSLVDYLASEVLLELSAAPSIADWAGEDAPYRSPLARDIEALRARIETQAHANGWTVRPEQLDDRHLIRRLILKRVVFGVDLNPMAVELSKLSLWLHSFTVGAPLSFLDHHLRVGDSLFGEFASPVEKDLSARFGLATSGDAGIARRSAGEMAKIEELSDADLGEVHESAKAYDAMEMMTFEWQAFLSLYHAARWLRTGDAVQDMALTALFGGSFGNPVKIASGTKLRAPRDAADIRKGTRRIPAAQVFAAASEFVESAKKLAASRLFLHWESAFPNVWTEWERDEPFGGFDAVIGNPPWDRLKMQEVEWFAARVPAVALAQRASDRKRMIADLRRAGDPIAAEYDEAVFVAERAIAVASGQGPFATGREISSLDSRDYPLLSGGDINLYALFIERARRIVRADGIVGLLVPSGIAGDKGASRFFRGISTTGRLGALLDFENRRTTFGQDPFFPDVDSRFKFCALIFGGRERSFGAAACAFFQQDAAAAEANAFTLTPEDFAAVNPNTGTAPVFRTRRDADITRAIYRSHPVLVDRSGPAPRAVWPVRYMRMFDMTNDSDKFVTEAELVAKGAYKVRGARWERGDERWLPLMTGRTINLFDHRAASVTENPASLHNPFNSRLTTEQEHKDPGYGTQPQFWVRWRSLAWPSTLDWAIAFRDIARPTDARTLISAIVPISAFANTAPLLMPVEAPLFDPIFPPSDESRYAFFAPLLQANMASLAIDYVVRQKVQSTHLNYYIMEQLPFITHDKFSKKFGTKTAEQIIREDVLHLTYTAHDMQPFAQDQGFAGPPFAWDEEDRLRRRARLDAVFLHLYGIDRDTAAYILSTFPIVQREEEQRFGRFRTRALVHSYMSALAAGRPDADIDG